MASPVERGQPPVLPSAQKGDRKERKRKGSEDGAEPPAASHKHVAKGKKGAKPKLVELSKEHQEYVRGFITELHVVATADSWLQLPQPMRLANFFGQKKAEIIEKQDKVSPIAAFRFLKSDPDLKQKTIAGFNAITFPSWTALNGLIATLNLLQADAAEAARVEAEVLEKVEAELDQAIAAEDPIAEGIDAEKKAAIMESVKAKDPKALVQHFFPEVRF